MIVVNFSSSLPQQQRTCRHLFPILQRLDALDLRASLNLLALHAQAATSSHTDKACEPVRRVSCDVISHCRLVDLQTRWHCCHQPRGLRFRHQTYYAFM